jgi:hypothetical protein
MDSNWNKADLAAVILLAPGGVHSPGKRWSAQRVSFDAPFGLRDGYSGRTAVGDCGSSDSLLSRIA